MELSMPAQVRGLVQRLDQRAGPDLSDALENLARAVMPVNEQCEYRRLPNAR